ncbi:uncharacterized protein LOC142233396 [Haematobia irritans]|uniref:uncharacterized protein LOC142233396 n=1 Tax=Haematobia irritans TaxID=7368 RepID=UPI003F50C44D
MKTDIGFGDGVYLKFTNLECESFNKSVASFEKCKLKALARHNVSLDIYIKLNVLPVSEIMLNAQLLHKGNGYRPFMYNDTMDFCRFMKNPKRWMFWKIVWDAVMPSTNLNHTCPVVHDIVVNQLSLNPEMMKLVPFPANTYLVRLTFFNTQYRGLEVRVYITVYN